MSGFWTDITAQRQRGRKCILCLGNGKWSDAAALNIVYVRQCRGDKMRHLGTRLRMPC